ncbi:uncharacterized protein F4822DRAFT_423816 [Hypoxylon trugodes]|uniref:uncharacterized protein n=1 Tax=Hypoxylon trugodes TaxID=326681 RepID=UPI00218C9DD1|nr:uncharacterized protein F4822DRAFT_423816 [Hypoxylon trugodes]KAI1393345.1 hypothetical protein F4822DRAFT_423816 [Hypoxylon trugodes]
MCRYICVTYRCQHRELFAGPNCLKVSFQLYQIERDASAWTSEGRKALPFTWADDCNPNCNNITEFICRDFCGWECRNSYPGNHTRVPIQAAGTEKLEVFHTRAGAGPWHVHIAGGRESNVNLNPEPNATSASGNAGQAINLTTASGEAAGEYVLQRVMRIGSRFAAYGVPRSGIGWFFVTHDESWLGQFTQFPRDKFLIEK